MHACMKCPRISNLHFKENVNNVWLHGKNIGKSKGVKKKFYCLVIYEDKLRKKINLRK